MTAKRFYNLLQSRYSELSRQQFTWRMECLSPEMAPSHLEVSSVRGWSVCAVVKPGLRRLVVLIPPVASGLSLYCGCIDSLVVSVCVCVQVCTSLASSASYCPVKPGYEVTYWHANFTSNKSCDCIHSLNYVVLLKRSLVPRPCPAFCHLLDGARNWHSRFALATHALLASHPGHS